ncbi:MAG: hypothetical protein U0325_01320 [Polyangiales bacterium]
MGRRPQPMRAAVSGAPVGAIAAGRVELAAVSIAWLMPPSLARASRCAVASVSEVVA